MMGLGKGNSLLKHGQVLVSMLDYRVCVEKCITNNDWKWRFLRLPQICFEEQHQSCWYCWWFRNPANQLRLVVYPQYLQGYIHPRWFSRRISEPSTVLLIARFKTWICISFAFIPPEGIRWHSSNSPCTWQFFVTFLGWWKRDPFNG